MMFHPINCDDAKSIRQKYDKSEQEVHEEQIISSS